MMILLIAIAVMMAATIAVHLGLPQTISNVVSRVCKCHKCLSFWVTLAVLLLIGCNIIIAAMLSLVMAYMSNWFGMLLIWLNDKYGELWQRLNQKKM
jgi:hypothetical protein